MNQVHYIAKPASQHTNKGVTSCGAPLGGIDFFDLTDLPDYVTCAACLQAKNHDLHVLSNTDL